MSSLSSSPYPARFAQLAALWAYSVSVPVFSLLDGNPEFLVVRGSTRAEVVVFALVLAFGPPVAALALEWLGSVISPGVGDRVHLVFVGLFAAPLAMMLVRLADPGAGVALSVTLAFAGLMVLAYTKWRPVRLFLTLSFVLPLIGLVSFVFGTNLVTDDAVGANASVTKSVPVVLVVFDEFPVSSIMTSAGQIDAVRFPNFGRLADTATWYRRATTVHEHTTGAVPAILTGVLPQPGALPTLTDHPENLFTLLGEQYAMRVHEEVTYLCPKRYCPRPRDPILGRLTGLFGDVRVAYLQSILPGSVVDRLPTIDDRWYGFTNAERLLTADDRLDVDAVVNNRTRSARHVVDEVLSGFHEGEVPRTLHFAHLEIPHAPWRNLRSGIDYGDGDTVHGLDGDYWGADHWLVMQAYQRHLVQVAYADTVLGRILDRLKRERLFDRALVVVVADHGASFTVGDSRRHVTSTNLADIARIPLLVKLPGQRQGNVDHRPVKTVDIVPTITDVLGVQTPWHVDGHSLLGDYRGSNVVEVKSRDRTPVRAPVEVIDRKQAATLRTKAAFFGQGASSLFAIGEHKDLLGRRVVDLGVTPSTASVRFDNAALLDDVRPSTSFLPALVSGTVEGGAFGRDVEIAVALNGRITALTRLFEDSGQRFTALVPERAFRPGSNRVEVIAIQVSESTPRFYLLEAVDS